MANERITAELVLGVNNFNRQIEGARQSLRRLGDSTAGKGLLNVFGKLAPAIGAVTTAGVAFDKFIQSSQTTTDAFGRTLEATTAIVNSFFSSISMGDFSSFLSGLDGVIDQAQKAYNALDALGTATIINTSFFEQKNSEIAKLKSIIKGTDTTSSERDSAKKRYKEVLAEYENEMQYQIKLSEDAQREFFKSVTKNLGGNITDETYKRYSAIVSKGTTNAENDAWVEAYMAESERLAKEASEKGSSVYNQYTGMTGKQMEYQRVMKERMNDEEYKARLAIKELGDQDLQKYKQLAQQIAQLQSRLANLKAESAELMRFQGYDVQKSQGNTEQINSASAELRKKFSEKSKINAEIPLKTTFNKESQQSLDYSIAKLKQQIAETMAQMETGDIQFIDEYRAKLKTLQDELYILETPLEDLQSNLTSYTVEGIEAVGGLTSAFASLGDVMDEDASAIERIGAGIQAMTGILQAGMQVAEAFNRIEQASIAISKAKAAANASEAITEGVSKATSSSKHWIELIMAVASVTGAIMGSLSMAKFANGGIVGGSSTSGDSLLVRANTGEMILNQRHQSRLFNMIDGSAGVPTKSGGNVQFRISGRDLVGTLQAHNNYTNKGK